MSYKVEVTAASVPELASKLLAMGLSMQGGVAVVHSSANDPVMPEVKGAAPKAKKVKEVAEKAPADPTPEAQTGEAASPAEPALEPAAPEPAPSAPSAEASASEPLDFDKDVAPVVLNAVKVKGKPWVQEVLSQFGVERASQVPDEQLGELVAAMNEGVNA